jgi:hypothetical protein
VVIDDSDRRRDRAFWPRIFSVIEKRHLRGGDLGLQADAGSPNAVGQSIGRKQPVRSGEPLAHSVSGALHRTIGRPTNDPKRRPEISSRELVRCAGAVSARPSSDKRWADRMEASML